MLLIFVIIQLNRKFHMAKRFTHNIFDPQSDCIWTYVGEKAEVINTATEHVIMEDVSLHDNPSLRAAIEASLIEEDE